MDCLQKSAPTAETVFYNSDIDNEDDDEGSIMAQSMGGGGDRCAHFSHRMPFSRFRSQ